MSSSGTALTTNLSDHPFGRSLSESKLLLTVEFERVQCNNTASHTMSRCPAVAWPRVFLGQLSPSGDATAGVIWSDLGYYTYWRIGGKFNFLDHNEAIWKICRSSTASLAAGRNVTAATLEPAAGAGGGERIRSVDNILSAQTAAVRWPRGDLEGQQ